MILMPLAAIMQEESHLALYSPVAVAPAEMVEEMELPVVVSVFVLRRYIMGQDQPFKLGLSPRTLLILVHHVVLLWFVHHVLLLDFLF